MLSKTQAALALVDEGQTVRQAARTVDVSEAAVYRAIKERAASRTGFCSKCGGLVGENGKTLGTVGEPVPGFLKG